MTSKTACEEKISRLAVNGISLLCGVLLGGGMVINALGLQNIPELSKELPTLLKLQEGADQAIFYSYVGIAIILLVELLPKRKKKEPQPSTLP